MRYQQINDLYHSLADQWRDLAHSLRSLALLDPVGDPRRDDLERQADLCEHNVVPGFQPGYFQRASALRAGPQINPSLQDAIRLAIANLQAHNRHRQGVEDNFIRHFPVPLGGQADPVKEVRKCREILRHLNQFISDNLQDLTLRYQELASPDTTVAATFGGVKDTIDDIASYPVLTSELNIIPSAIGPSAPGGGSGNSLQRTVDTAMRAVLGYLPKAKDTRSFMLALNQSFQVAEVEGHSVVTWTPRSYTGQTDVGGSVTGGQASLYTRSKVALDHALPLLDGLYPLLPDYDPQLVEAARSIVHSELEQIVTELGTEGGPRVARVNQLFESLLDDPNPHPYDPSQPAMNGGHLVYLREVFGVLQTRVNTLEEEHNVTNFTALDDYAKSIRVSWENFRDNLLGNDLGTLLVQLTRTLSVTAETVDELNFAMDSVFIGPAERQVIVFNDGDNGNVLIDELLSWVSVFASEEAPYLVREAGKRGAAAIVPKGEELVRLVERFLQQIRYNADLPAGLRHPRIQPPLRELLTHLKRVVDLAQRLA